jgi:hypothetical protein
MGNCMCRQDEHTQKLSNLKKRNDLPPQVVCEQFVFCLFSVSNEQRAACASMDVAEGERAIMRFRVTQIPLAPVQQLHVW